MNQSQLGSFENIPIARIRPSGTNPRKSFDAVAMEELTNSVREMGVTQPLLLRPWKRYIVEPFEGGGQRVIDRANQKVVKVLDTGIASANLDQAEAIVAAKNGATAEYEIVSGERRFRAASAAKLETVPAIVEGLSDENARAVQMIENLQRADLHPVEEADGYREMMDRGATPEDVAKKTGKQLSYVLQRIKLLTLGDEAKRLFMDAHLTLGHALLLARLTPADQERALRFMLRIDGDYQRDNFPAALKQRMSNWKSYTPHTRLSETTEAQLRDWIQSHVLLQLKSVPWNLADPFAGCPDIVGACDGCPFRSSTSPALFGDITGEEDVCTNPRCFAAKQKETASRLVKAAKEQGTPLLKVSSKSSYDKLEKQVVEVTKGKPAVVTGKAVKMGQWVDAKKNSCPATVQAVVTDGSDSGKVKYVCADQKCNVHRHTVHDRVVARIANISASGRTPEEDAKRELAQQREVAVRLELLRAVAAADPLLALRAAVERALEDTDTGAPFVANAFGLTVAASKSHWEENEWAVGAIAKWLQSQPLPKLLELAVALAVVEDFDPVSYGGGDRKDAWKIAKACGIKPDVIAKRVEKDFDAKQKKLSPDEQKQRKAAEAKKHANGAVANKAAAKRVLAASATSTDRKSAAAGEREEMAGA